jgi:hypothetical protein
MTDTQDVTGFTPKQYRDEEFSGMIDNQILHDHMGLHDILDVLISASAKRCDDYNLSLEQPYTSSTSPVTFAKGVAKFLEWWNKVRDILLGTLLYYRRLPKDSDRRILSSKSIKKLSELTDYNDIKESLRKMITSNKDFRVSFMFS